MARIGLGFTAIAAAMLMLGATPALACGSEGAGHSCHCMGGAKAEAKTDPGASPSTAKAEVDVCGKDGSQCACMGPAIPAPASAPAPAPKAGAKKAAPETKPQSCTLHPGDDALAGKCSCAGPSDCTCKKNDCQCPKCKTHRAGGGARGA